MFRFPGRSEIEVVKGDSRHRIKRARRMFPILEVWVRSLELGNAGPILPKKYETIRLRERQGSQNYAMHHTEHRGVRADAQCNCEHCDAGESGISNQRAQAKPYITRQSIEGGIGHPGIPRVRMHFFNMRRYIRTLGAQFNARLQQEFSWQARRGRLRPISDEATGC